MITQSIRNFHTPYHFRLKYDLVIINEYKFYVDFKGLMYFDHGGPISPTNLITDRKFINKFYQNLKENKEQINLEFPFVGQFWGQKNYLRYALAPIVFSNLEDDSLQFCGGVKISFSPQQLYQDLEGQLCYPYKSDFIKLKGIFSNGLVSHIIPHITHIDDKTFYNYKERSFLVKTKGKVN